MMFLAPFKIIKKRKEEEERKTGGVEEEKEKKEGTYSGSQDGLLGTFVPISRNEWIKSFCFGKLHEKCPSCLH